MPSDFMPSQHAEPWDGITERRKVPRDHYEEKRGAHTASAAPDAPITREYLDQALSDWRHGSREYFNTHFIRLEELIRDGFPGGDTRAHREVHERYIKEAADRAALMKSIREKLVTAAVYAVAVLVGTALWQHFIHLIAAGAK